MMNTYCLGTVAVVSEDVAQHGRNYLLRSGKVTQSEISDNAV